MTCEFISHNTSFNSRHSLSTLPSKGFLQDFAVIYELSYVSSQKPFYNEKYTYEELNHAIRVVLDGVVALTEKFDGAYFSSLCQK